MDRRTFLLSPLALSLFAPPLTVQAQPARKIPRVGYLGNVSFSPPVEAFRAGLRELGWVEGRNIVVEGRYELLKEAVPGLSRVGVLREASADPFRPTDQTIAAARSLRVEILPFEAPRAPRSGEPDQRGRERAGRWHGRLRHSAVRPERGGDR
jgi:hypothetical protein